MKHISTISSLFLLGTTVSFLMKKRRFNQTAALDSAEAGYQLYL